MAFSSHALVSLAIFLYQQSWQSQEMVRRFSDLAGVVGLNSVAALTFKDPQAAVTTPKALAGEDEFISATLFNQQGMIFAHYAKQKERDSLEGHTPFSSYKGVWESICSSLRALLEDAFRDRLPKSIRI